MAEQKKPVSAATIAAFLAGAGFGVGTEVIIKPAVPEEPGWSCTVLADERVLCKPFAQIELPPDDLVVRDAPDGGTDGGVP
jgi:hypothetical protein